MSKLPSKISSKGDNPFGTLLGIIIRTCRLNYREAGVLLGTSPVTISDIVAGKKLISQEFIEIRRWRDRFADNYPEVWQKHREAFEHEASLLEPMNRGRKLRDGARLDAGGSKRSPLHKEPEDKDTLGFMLWNILGGVTLNSDKAGKILQISESRLYSILHSYANLSQDYVVHREWPAQLREHFPSAWDQFGQRFLICLQQLPLRRSRPRRLPAPKNEFSLGYTVWKILEGPYIRSRIAADFLGISPHQLSGVLHNKKWRCLESLKIDHWGNIFAVHYPNTWKLYGEQFNRYAADFQLDERQD